MPLPGCKSRNIFEWTFWDMHNTFFLYHSCWTRGGTSANVLGAPRPRPLKRAWQAISGGLSDVGLGALHSHIRTQSRDCESQSSMTLFLFLPSFCDSHGTESKRALFWILGEEHIFGSFVSFGGTERSSSSAPCYILRRERERRLEEGKRLEFQIPTRWKLEMEE